MHGLVIKNTGSRYTVCTDDNQLINCNIKGNFRLKDIRSTNPVVIGDMVKIEMNGFDAAFITAIEPRRNYMIRKASNLSKQSHILAANIDLALLIVTVNYPVTTTVFIDRFLATAEAYQIPVNIVFNKIDRLNEAEKLGLEDLILIYQSIGYTCFKVCAVTGDGIEPLKEVLTGKVTLIAGHSGVGKSTLINKILPGVNLKTAVISEYHRKGMHTTTFSEMIPIPGGGYMIDTPGIKGFGTIEMEGAEVAHYFPEIFKVSADCKYHNCTHRHEPDCAVLEALDNHAISESRYKSYLNILEDRDGGKYREPF
ncbi:MAG: ribosome small subunit-dependent GTPase A [Tannerella sp.]|jgi:ribosome biogenesis GTPase|nr:ribosome small subunit-dependent GTPase A [Tannerella sp.]